MPQYLIRLIQDTFLHVDPHTDFNSLNRHLTSLMPVQSNIGTPRSDNDFSPIIFGDFTFMYYFYRLLLKLL